MLQWLMRKRGRRKAAWIAPSVKGGSVLDLGAGEGYVGEALRDMTGCDVTLVDVIDIHRVALPFHLYDGYHLPFADGQFETVVASLVLHHCADPLRVLSEAARVCRTRIVVIESVYLSESGKKLLAFLDRLANGVRSDGQISAPLHFQTEQKWHRDFQELGFTVKEQRWLTHFIHHQMLFALDVSKR